MLARREFGRVTLATWLANAAPAAAQTRAPIDPNAAGNATIRGRAGDSDIVIQTTARLAGAIHSLRWSGVEFVDSLDHGRQIQSASNLDVDGAPMIGETFNPTEAGSRDDHVGPRSTSRLRELKVLAPNELRTTNQMAFWLRPGEKSRGNPARNRTLLSNHLVSKHVAIGVAGLPHAIAYDVAFTLPADERHTYAQFEAVTGYMPPRFEVFLRVDMKSRTLVPLDDGPGEQRDPVVLATATGSHAMGVFSPDQPAPGFPNAGYGRFRFKSARVTKWNCVFRVRDPRGLPPGPYRYRHFLAVGTRADVESTLAALVARYQRA